MELNRVKNCSPLAIHDKPEHGSKKDIKIAAKTRHRHSGAISVIGFISRLNNRSK